MLSRGIVQPPSMEIFKRTELSPKGPTLGSLLLPFRLHGDAELKMAAKTDNLLQGKRSWQPGDSPCYGKTHSQQKHSSAAMPKPFGGRQPPTFQARRAGAGERLPGVGRLSSLSISQPAGSPGVRALGASGFSKQSHQQKGKTH